jgi:hypothetical protein
MYTPKLASWTCLLVLCWTGLGCAPRSTPPAKEVTVIDPSDSMTVSPRIRLNRGVVEVSDVPQSIRKTLAALDSQSKRWHDYFLVHVVSEKTRGPKATPLPLLGTYAVKDGVVRFQPRFPLEPGVRYRAVFGSADRPGERIETIVSLPRPPTVPTTVAHVYPSGGRLPENQLKFYLHFSAPMSRGEAYQHIRLLDARGKPIDLPFLELDQELWDAEGQRFTLFFDPGRIKRGLKPREEVGPALEEGKRYTLVIDRAWNDAEGNPLKETFRKTFDVGPPDDTQPNPKTWKLQAPPAGRLDALVVDFPKPMEHALLHRLLWITDPAGRKVSGKVVVSREEKRWSFTPARGWKAGTYHLVADTRLEDLSGNSIGRPFEVDVFRPIERTVKAETVTIPFEVRAITP